MLVVKINVVHAQALQAGFTRSANVLWIAASSHSLVAGIEEDSEFGGNLHLITDACDRLDK